MVVWCLLSLALSQPAEEKPGLVVLEFTAAGGADPAVAGVLSENVAAEIAARGFFQVISTREMQSILGVERQRQLMGCGDDSCTAELAGALGARFVLSGSLTRLGSLLQLNLQVLDTQKAQVLGRSTRLAPDAAGLAAQLPTAVAEGTATPPPPEKSRAVPITLLSAGGLGVVVGAVLAINAFSREQVMNEELTQTSVPLRSLAEYEKALADLRVMQFIALGAGVAGLALAAVATLLLALPDQPAGTTKVALVPSGAGLSLVGVFP